VVFAGAALGAACCRRDGIEEQWGDNAPAVELTLCTLDASLDLPSFVALPNVIQEGTTVQFMVRAVTVSLSLREVMHEGKPAVAVESIAASALGSGR
jgi:hypothetical protein